MTLRGPVLYHLDGQNTMDEAIGVTVIKPELDGIQASLNLTMQTLMSEGGGVTPGETEGAGLEGANTATGLQILQEGKNQKIGKRQDEINEGILCILQQYAQIEADAFDEAFARLLFKNRLVEDVPEELQQPELMVADPSGAMEPVGDFPAATPEGDLILGGPGGGLQMEQAVDELGMPLMQPVMVPAVAPAIRSGGVWRRSGNSSPWLPPTMAPTTSGMVRPARSRVQTRRPLRITVTRSEIWKTSSRRCET